MSEERKHAEKSERESTVHVAVVEEGRHSQVVSESRDGKFRAIFPVEMCEHQHDTMEDAIVCGAPRVLAFVAIMHSIGKSMLQTLEESARE